MKHLFYLSIIYTLFSVAACSNMFHEHKHTIINAPAEIAERAYRFAELYAQSETAYAFGGQDALRAIQIDCSGLVIMCYKYALVDTKHSLLLPDMTADYMYRNAATMIDKSELKKGNVIFMGEAESQKITHIALFDRTENGNIYFIDSTQKDTNGDGINDIDGVTHRFYAENDARFKGFGMMRIRY